MGSYLVGCAWGGLREFVYEPIFEVLAWLRELNKLDPENAALAPTTYDWMFPTQYLNLSRAEDLQCWFAIREHLLLNIFPFLYSKIGNSLGWLLLGSGLTLIEKTVRLWQEALIINDGVSGYVAAVVFGFLMFIVSELSTIHSVQLAQ